MEGQGGEGNWSLAPFAGQVISTAFALDHMQKRGVDEREAAVLRAGEWLRSVQNADGGWGESGELAAGEAPSSAVNTACAVAGLVAGGDAGSESVRRGIDYLVRTQGEDGTWRDDGYNWALLPGLVECRSTLDALTLPLWALNAFLKHSEAGGAGSRRVY
jgi:squalene-hopene/tetraprenyl-beta-curcumene cyclase